LLLLICMTTWWWLYKSAKPRCSRHKECMTFIVLCYSVPVVNVDLTNTRWRYSREALKWAVLTHSIQTYQSTMQICIT
jgi:hypothetical protein